MFVLAIFLISCLSDSNDTSAEYNVVHLSDFGFCRFGLNTLTSKNSPLTTEPEPFARYI